MTTNRFRTIALAALLAAGLAAGTAAADDEPGHPVEPSLEESLDALGALLRDKLEQLEDGLDRTRRELEDRLRRQEGPPTGDAVPADEPMDI